jgi:hypothetical protein
VQRCIDAIKIDGNIKSKGYSPAESKSYTDKLAEIE